MAAKRSMSSPTAAYPCSSAVSCRTGSSDTHKHLLIATGGSEARRRFVQRLCIRILASRAMTPSASASRGLIIDFLNFWMMRHERAEPDESFSNDVRGGAIAVSLQQAPHACLFHNIARQLQVERRQSMCRIAHDFHGCPARAEREERSKRLVHRHAEDQLVRAGRRTIGCTVNPLMRAPGLSRAIRCSMPAAACSAFVPRPVVLCRSTTEVIRSATSVLEASAVGQSPGWRRRHRLRGQPPVWPHIFPGPHHR